MSRTARVERATSETKLVVELNLDGTGTSSISTGVGFYDHMLTALSKHSGIDLTVQAQLPPGAVIAYQHGGGAGFEPAILRDPEAVKEDVLDEIVSIEAARDRYGVVLSGTLDNYDLAVDLAATEALRREMGAAVPA